MASSNNVKTPVWFIAGCSTGIGRALADVFESPDPPLQLLMGKSALDRVREARAEQARSIDEWEKVTLATDFPER